MLFESKVIPSLKVKINGKMVQVQDKDLPEGVVFPYRINPGNIAVSNKYII